MVAEGLLTRLFQVALLALVTTAVAELVLDVAEVLPVSGGWLLVLGALAAGGPPLILLRLARR